MAIRTYFVGNSYIDNGTTVTVLSQTQVAPQYPATILGTPVNTTTVPGSSREMFGGGLVNGYLAPTTAQMTTAVAGTLATETPITGKFDAGNWTFRLGAAWFPVGGPSPVQWHVRIRIYHTNTLDTLNGLYEAHAVEVGNGFAGSVATSNFQQVGYSTVTAALPTFTMNNEYLIVYVGIYCDVAPTISNGLLGFWADQSTVLQTANFVSSVGAICKPNFVQRCPEAYEYHAPNGTVYPLDVNGIRFVLSAEGEGLPPINYTTQRGPFQHGTTLTDYFLQPRIVQLAIRHNYPNRDALHEGRQALVGVLSPGLQALTGVVQTGTLRKQLTTGELRDLRALILQGPNFNPRGKEWDEFAYTEVLRFQAFDPIWYDPAVETRVFAPQGSQLVYPITYPIIYTTLDSKLIIDYAGTWKAYPIFTITGPTIGVQIENQTTGDLIQVSYPLPAGRTYTIDLTPGNKQILLDDGTNLLGYLTAESDLSAWHLTPSNDGVNELRAYATGVNANSLVSMTWLDAYLGV